MPARWRRWEEHNEGHPCWFVFRFLLNLSLLICASTMWIFSIASRFSSICDRVTDLHNTEIAPSRQFVEPIIASSFSDNWNSSEMKKQTDWSQLTGCPPWLIITQVFSEADKNYGTASARTSDPGASHRTGSQPSDLKMFNRQPLDLKSAE
jgi:hypothetical protein